MARQLRGIRKQIVQALSRAIADGDYAPGSKLPTLRELGDTFGTSHANVAVAVQHLADEGLLIKRQGSGVYVNPKGTQEPDCLRIHCRNEIGDEVAAVIAQYQVENPDVAIYTDATEMAADIVFYGAIGVRCAARNGEIRCLDSYLDSHKMSREVFHPQALRPALNEGELYALPVVFSPELLHYNPELVAVPVGELAEWTLEEFHDYLVAQAPSLLARGISPYSPGVSYLGQVRPFLGLFGAAEVDASGSRCLLDQPEAHEALRFVRRLVAIGGGNNVSIHRIADMLERKAAFVTLSGMLYPRLRTVGAASIRPLPHPRGPRPPQEVSGMWAAIRSDCADPQLAWRFVQALVSREAQRSYAQAHLLFPVRRDALDYLVSMDPEVYTPLVRYLDELACEAPPYSRPDLFYLDQIMEDWLVTRDPSALLARACEKFDERLRRYALVGVPEFVGL